MPRKERGERVPKPIAWHNFNKTIRQTTSTEIDIVHFAKQLLSLELLAEADLATLAAQLHTSLKGKTFVSNDKTYRIVSVFNVGGAAAIRMRVEEVASDKDSES